MAADNILSNLVRIGKVVKLNGGTVTVKFESLGGMTADLKVLQTVSWSPAEEQYVVCLYLPVFNGDGFILGVVP